MFAQCLQLFERMRLQGIRLKEMDPAAVAIVLDGSLRLLAPVHVLTMTTAPASEQAFAAAMLDIRWRVSAFTQHVLAVLAWSQLGHKTAASQAFARIVKDTRSET
jgi:hypothetical protein